MGPFRQRGRRGAGTSVVGFGLPVIEDPAHLMAYEFARARRYERPISVLALPADDVPSGDIVRLRFSDIVALDRRRDVALVLLPETDSTDLAGALRRIRANMPVGIRIGGASFPEDALTLEHLMDVAADRMGVRVGATEAA